MNTIIARYEIDVYSNGEIKFKRMDHLEKKQIDYSKCSSRISQILMTVQEMEKRLSSGEYVSEIEIYTSAINEVAHKLGVNSTTIADKLTRQIGLTAEKARFMIFDYFRNRSTEFREVLKGKVGNNTRTQDINAIEAILK